MVAPSRFKNGVTNNAVGSTTANLPIPDATNIYIYQDDFSNYVAGDWTVTAGGSGSGTAIAAGTGGLLALTWATSGSQANVLANAGIAFQPTTSSTPGAQVWFECGYINGASATNPNYLIGLTKGTITSPTDGVYFTKAAAGVVWQLVIKAAAGSTTTITLPATANSSNSTHESLGFYYDAKPTPTLYVYSDGKVVGTVGTNGSLGTDLSNLPLSTVYLAPSFLIGTAAGPLTIDYVTAACEVPGRV